MKITCQCGQPMKYLVGNSGVEAHWCLVCGRAAMTDNGVVFEWYEPEREKLK